MKLAAGMERRPFPSPDAAIRSVARNPLDVRAIDMEHVGAGSSGPWQMQARIDRDLKVRAALGRFDADDRAILVRYAWGQSYADIARALRMRKGSCILRHRQARRALIDRLVKLGLLRNDA